MRCPVRRPAEYQLRTRIGAHTAKIKYDVSGLSLRTGPVPQQLLALRHTLHVALTLLEQTFGWYTEAGM